VNDALIATLFGELLLLENKKGSCTIVSLIQRMSLCSSHKPSFLGLGYVSSCSTATTWACTTSHYEISMCHAPSLVLYNIYWVIPSALDSRSLATSSNCELINLSLSRKFHFYDPTAAHYILKIHRQAEIDRLFSPEGKFCCLKTGLT
jgi:hypothetical protein